MNQLLVRAASNLSLVNISKGRSNRGGVGFIVTRKQNGLSGIGMAVSTGILEESASYTDANGYQSGEAIYRTLVPTVAQFKEHGRAIESKRQARDILPPIPVGNPAGERGLGSSSFIGPKLFFEGLPDQSHYIRQLVEITNGHLYGTVTPTAYVGDIPAQFQRNFGLQ